MLLDTARQLFAETASGDPYRGAGPSGRTDPRGPLPPLPRQGGPVPGGVEEVRTKSSDCSAVVRRQRGRRLGAVPGQQRGLSRCGVDQPRPTVRSVWSTGRPCSGLDGRGPSGGRADHRSWISGRCGGRRLLDPTGRTPGPSAVRPRGGLGHVRRPHEDPVAARREIGRCNERFLLAGLGVHGASDRAPAPRGRQTDPCAGHGHIERRDGNEAGISPPSLNSRPSWTGRASSCAGPGRAARSPLSPSPIPSAGRRAATHRGPNEGGGAGPRSVGRPPRARARAARGTASSSWRCSTRSWACRAGLPSSSAPRPPTPATPRSSLTTAPRSRRRSTSSPCSTARCSPVTP